MTGLPRVLLFALLLVGADIAAAAAPPVAAVKPGHAAIASAHRLATEAGLEVLDKGGNAFDAAIAVAATLAVVEPQSSGIGGGFFMLIHRAADGREAMIDAREVAPAAVDAKAYADADGRPNRDAATNGPTSAGIPGEPAGLAGVAAHYGKLPLKASLAPAIRIATNGFKPDARFLGRLQERREVIARYPASAALLLAADRQVPKPGWVFRQPDLARTLERLAAQGADGFYRGETARALVDSVRAAGGNWTLDDLAGYRVVEREPIRFDYRGWRIVTAPPPSSGGVALAEIFNILRGYDLAAMAPAQRYHAIIEAMRRAFRDHNEYLGDPDFVKMPLDMLLSPHYADGLRASILPDKATPSAMLPAALAHEPGTDTTHFSIVDRDGNMVACTSTVNLPFGSAFVAGGTGVILNDEMDDFALVPDAPNAFGLRGNQANAPAPGKRMLSSMSPTFVFGKDRIGVLGTPGGSTIITQVFEGILAFMDGKPAATITAQPRYHHQYLPDLVYVEPHAFDDATTKALQDMGYTFKQRDGWGFMNVVTWDLGTGKLDAASDPRGVSGLGKVK
ncbi:MAG: gamma-glutamyltransferase [Mizugakiibacter sp.]|uniref:gamma-glutamyltransferase n=1 Tax=Mizugakiibacter sp. TaxID=1972610 RepID=UPI003211189B